MTPNPHKTVSKLAVPFTFWICGFLRAACSSRCPPLSQIMDTERLLNTGTAIDQSLAKGSVREISDLKSQQLRRKAASVEVSEGQKSNCESEERK